MRRLLARHYRNSIGDLLGPTAKAAAVPPADQPLNGFDLVGAAQLNVGDLAVVEYEKSARLAPITYTQIASIDQSGGIHGGHYIAHALRRNRVAHDFNDTMVGPGVLTPNPNTYMVFYHKDDAAAQN